MNETANRALLPVGLRDILPPFAEHEAKVVGRLAKFFTAHGYERVKPPLIEFEESLLSASGAAMAPHTFRLMDPMSQRMLAVRADMTLQVARIATTRLGNAPRPLRLSYAGQVLRVRGSQLRPERQFGQAGIELIGADNAAADAEVIALSAGALVDQGMKGVSVDLSLPALVPLVIGKENNVKLREALDDKDAATVRQLAGATGDVLVALIEAAGPAERALEKLAKLDLPAGAAAQRAHLAEVVRLVHEAVPDLALTVDPVENRGFEYHTGIAFTLFSKQASGELGRGGRYFADGEPATGATLFMDTVLDAMPAPEPAKRLYVPVGTAAAKAQKLRTEGWITVAGLAAVKDVKAEAKRLGCGFVLSGDQPVSAE
ncbi:MAG TPA: ATP phosphoribosyltransferase regulatory subunit [Magnetospirillaceae bacterium]|jgi:ATP phosphoribosyltransferase regulatory subunit